jgi:RimJ/RimL family protein N-acetyltransferase
MAYIFETERLGLRMLTMADEADMAKIICDDETMWAFGGGWDSAANHAGMLKQLHHYEDFGFGRWAVEIKDTQQFIGICGPQWWEDQAGRLIELGFFFNKRYWHHGYATEAAKACIDYCFNTLSMYELSSIIHAKNIPSMNVAIRSGMLAQQLYEEAPSKWQYRFNIKNPNH